MRCPGQCEKGALGGRRVLQSFPPREAEEIGCKGGEGGVHSVYQVFHCTGQRDRKGGGGGGGTPGP